MSRFLTKKILIIGAGGYGQVVADILTEAHQAGESVCPIGYIDKGPALIGQTFLGLPVLGTEKQLSKISHDAIIIAIGDNKIRQKVFEKLTKQKENFVIARHPSTVIGSHVILGPGTVICAGVVINPGTTIGANVILNTGCTIDHHSFIQDHAHIAPGVHLGGEVVVGKGTLIGIGASVIPGCHIGAECTVGAGAVVIKNLPEGVTAVGVPAKIVASG